MEIKNGVAVVRVTARRVTFHEADLELTSRGYVRSDEWNTLPMLGEIRAKVVKVS